MDIHSLKSTWRTCTRYNRCPIDYKCLAYDSSYVPCDTCEAGWAHCDHQDWELKLMIRRENFKLTVSEDIKEQIKKLGEVKHG